MSHACMLSSKSFGSVLLQSVGVKSSCIAASLWMSTTSETTPRPNHGLLCDHFDTTLGIVYTGIMNEIFNSSRLRGLIPSTNGLKFSYKLQESELVALTTSGFYVPGHWVGAQRVWSGLKHW